MKGGEMMAYVKKIAGLVLSVMMVFTFIPLLGGQAALANSMPDAPKNVTLQASVSSNGVISKVTAGWDVVEGAEGYEIAIFETYGDGDYINATNYFDANEATEADGRMTLDVSEYTMDYEGSFKCRVIAYDDETETGESEFSDAVEVNAIHLYGNIKDEITAMILKGSKIGPCVKEIIDNSIAANEGIFYITSNGDYCYYDSEGTSHELMCVADGDQNRDTVAEMIAGAFFVPPATVSEKTYSEGGSETEVYGLVYSRDDLCTDGEFHDYDMKINKADLTNDGLIYYQCSKCNEIGDGLMTPIGHVNGFKLVKASYTYTGKAIKPQVTVTNIFGDVLTNGLNYTTAYSNNTNAGTASVKLTLAGDFYAGTKTLTFKINKAANTLAVKAKTATVKYAKVRKKAQTLKVNKVLTVSKAKGTVTYAKASGNKKINIAKKTGKITVKKGLKKGTYKVKVKVKAAGTKNYMPLMKTVTFKVRVK